MVGVDLLGVGPQHARGKAGLGVVVDRQNPLPGQPQGPEAHVGDRAFSDTAFQGGRADDSHASFPRKLSPFGDDIGRSNDAPLTVNGAGPLTVNGVRADASARG